MSDYPMGQDCDVDGIVAWYRWRNARVDAAIKFAYDYCTGMTATLTGITPLKLDFLCDLPAAAGLGGAGFPVPVSGLPTAPGTPNETRNT